MANKLFLTLLIISTAFMCLNAEYSRDNEPRHFSDAKVIRIKYISGETFVKREYADSMEEGSVNLPLFDKDTVTTTDGRMELYIGRLNYIRLDYDSRLVISKAPALRKTRASFRLLKGGMILDIAELDYEKDIEIQTPDCGVFILRRGVYRINVLDNNKTEVISYKGRAEISGERYHKTLRRDQKAAFRDGRIIERPYYFSNNYKDDFDAWSAKRTREIGYSRNYGSRYLDKGYEDHESELSRSGRWKYSSDFGRYVWIPYNIAVDWRPYSNGRWVWHPHYGYVWSSYDSWGWATHHYGRWHWSVMDGWYWIPGYRWSSAWVSWCWNDSYYGWSPLSYYNRPVIVINGRWHRHYRYRRGIPFHSRSTIIIKRGHIGHSRISRISVRNRHSNSSSIRVVHRGHAPTRRIKYSTVRRVDAKGRSVRVRSAGSFGRKTTVVRKTGTISKSRVYRYSSGNRSGSTRVIRKSGTSSTTYRGSSTRAIKKKRYNSSPSGSSSRSVFKKSYNDSDVRSVKKSRVNKTTVKHTPRYRSGNSSEYRSPYSGSSSGSIKKYRSKSNTVDRRSTTYDNTYRSYKPSVKKRSSYSSSSSSSSVYKPTRKVRPSSESSYRSYTSPSRSYSAPKVKKRSSYSGSYSAPRSVKRSSSRSYSPPKSVSRSSSSRSYSPPKSVRRSSSGSRSISRSSSSSSRSVRTVKRKK